MIMGLALLRTSAFVVSSPLFGAPQIPNQLKILFSLSLVIATLPLINKSNLSIDSSKIIEIAIREVLVGLVLGLFIRLLFTSVSIGGELVSFSMGLNSAQVFNPMMGTHSNIMDQLYSILILLLFLGLNGHHMLLEGWLQSFKFLPINGFNVNIPSFGEVTLLGGEIIEIGFKIAGPIVITAFCLNLVMGVLGRAVPQINILVTSFPVAFLIGVLVLFLSWPILVNFMEEDFNRWGIQFFAFIKGVGHG